MDFLNFLKTIPQANSEAKTFWKSKLCSFINAWTRHTKKLYFLSYQRTARFWTVKKQQQKMEFSKICSKRDALICDKTCKYPNLHCSEAFKNDYTVPCFVCFSQISQYLLIILHNLCWFGSYWMLLLGGNTLTVTAGHGFERFCPVCFLEISIFSWKKVKNTIF